MAKIDGALLATMTEPGPEDGASISSQRLRELLAVKIVDDRDVESLKVMALE